MRIVIAFIILAVSGGLLTAGMTIDNRTLSPSELENVRTVCLGCHGQVPQYDFASRVHVKHAAFECNFCHSYDNAIKPAGAFHTGLEWLGIGAILLGLSGIITNALIINSKGRAR